MTNAQSKPISNILQTEEGSNIVMKRFKALLKHEKKREERFLIPLIKKLDVKYKEIIITMVSIHFGLCDIYKAVIEKNKEEFKSEIDCIFSNLLELTNQLQLEDNDRHKKIFALFIRYTKKYVRIVNKMNNFENSGYF